MMPSAVIPSALSPAKVLLLAVHFATHANIDSLTSLCQLHASTLHEELLLRILLTYLPETIRPELYVGLLQQILERDFQDTKAHAPDSSPVDALTEAEAAKKVKRLHLRSLNGPLIHESFQRDVLSSFLVLRARSIDTETGTPSQFLDLLLPFIHRSSYLCTWISSIVVPYVKKEQAVDSRNSLLQFEALSDAEASIFLLSRQPDMPSTVQLDIDHDLRESFGPWLYNPDRWKEAEPDGGKDIVCEGWQEFRTWLVSQAASSWPIAVQVLEKWGGIDDVCLSHGLTMKLAKRFQDHCRETYAATTLACVYSIQDTSLECLSRLYNIVAKLRVRLAYDEKYESLEKALETLPDLSLHNISTLWQDRTASLAKDNILAPKNLLTSPTAESTRLLLALILSAYNLTLHGHPSSVRRVGDLTFLRDTRDQNAVFTKLLWTIEKQASTCDDEYIVWARKRLLWLRGWRDAAATVPQEIDNGTFCAIHRESMDADFLKLMLSSGRYDLARSLFEDTDYKPLPEKAIQEVVHKSALAAFDNATSPDRARGGLKRCDEILRALPATVGPSSAGTKRIRALLKATHALSGYRLVLRAGESVSPVVLRVHSDPISIVGKILAQNPGAYTRLQEFLEMGINISEAGLPCHSVHLTASSLTTEQLQTHKEVSERRITALCIQAALSEEDFETAYSYVASRLGTQAGNASSAAQHVMDDWSWRAALQAGQYVRTERSKKPTHLGTASGNPTIRHLQQRLECLATALRVAPTSELQDILQSFRRCEEQLDSAVKEEATNEAAWDAEADAGRLPGSFDRPLFDERCLSRTLNASAASRQMDEAPMSLFDLSRATARVAQKNLSIMSGLKSISGDVGLVGQELHDESNQRVRKRDQLREAATGTLVSGVGWLIGANVNPNRTSRGEM
ncbi:hypothetical protein E4U60_001877 [Claviceps pazoutovae]|uniref:Sec39 domain-containing protein n=1 Tax=Claviceps pazoutovae TaxID=1649127 RepID=A0A9P7SL85_9HYPO|nr:hypothetical protein E4U60_001877 [Claviceps pazoutovae]